MNMNTTSLLLCLTLVHACFAHSTSPGIHLPLFRRGGRFFHPEPANLTYLSQILQGVEGRYARSYRAVEGNRLVRKWRQSNGQDENDPEVVEVAGHEGRWYTVLDVGNPKQELEVDIDMLSPDFYTIVTASGSGVAYNASASASHGFSDKKVHPICKSPSEEFHFPTRYPVRLDLPTCTPSKSSRQILANSGTILGLAPHTASLARLSSSPLLSQMHDTKTITDKLWSITLLDTETGILSLGGTIARQVDEAKIRGQVELTHFGDSMATSEWVDGQVGKQLRISMPEGMARDQHFKWTEVQGAKGWWTALMKGVWINGAKILKNQPILLDINVPFILAPPIAAARSYTSIPGTKRLPPPHDNFFAYPCLNHPNIAFEIGGWNFPTMQGEGTSADALFGPAGGVFSLGKISDGTGYCVGAVVETRMGGTTAGMEAGMKDMWVLGERFFRGFGVVFDEVEGRVGVRTY